MSKINNIAKYRELSGLTQEELAEILEVSTNTIANWERNRASKWIKNLNKLCKVLNCDLDDLDETAYPQPQIEFDFNDDIQKKIKSYCLAVLKNEKKKLKQIAHFATVYDPSLRFWLTEAQKAIADWQSNNSEEIDIDFIINSLIFRGLSLQLNQKLPNEIDLEFFQEIVLKTNFSTNFLGKYANFDSNNPHRTLVFKTKYLSLYVMGWQPGQKSSPHHHGNSLDAFLTLDGEIHHEFDTDKQSNKTNNDSQNSSRTIETGNWVFIDRGESHQIGNLTDKQTISFHVRFGTPPDNDKWEIKITNERTTIAEKLAERYRVMSYPNAAKQN